MCAISVEATQEAALEGMLRKVQDKWIGVELTVKQYKEAKDAYILGSVEDIQAVLEDSLAVMATISSSRFVTGHLSLCQIICFSMCSLQCMLHAGAWSECIVHCMLEQTHWCSLFCTRGASCAWKNSLTLSGAALCLGL